MHSMANLQNYPQIRTHSEKFLTHFDNEGGTTSVEMSSFKGKIESSHRFNHEVMGFMKVDILVFSLSQMARNSYYPVRVNIRKHPSSGYLVCKNYQFLLMRSIRESIIHSLSSKQ